jgi:tetratricopeptide (TPR) repeat protein
MDGSLDLAGLCSEDFAGVDMGDEEEEEEEGGELVGNSLPPPPPSRAVAPPPPPVTPPRQAQLWLQDGLWRDKEVVLEAGPPELPEDRAESQRHQLFKLERCVIQCSLGGEDWSGCPEQAVHAAKDLVEGRYLSLLQSGRLFGDCWGGFGTPADIRTRVIEFVGGGDSDGASWRAAEALWTGAAALNIFVQSNYTGPELREEDVKAVISSLVLAEEQGSASILSIDGELPYPRSSHPSALVIACAILDSLQDQGLSTTEWWCSRAVVAHARLLLVPGRSPSLWKRAQGLFSRVLSEFGGCAGEMGTRAWLEWGMAQHHFEDPSKGKHSFERARQACGLEVEVSGALGRRTKYQQTPHAQLVLKTTSRAAGGAAAVEDVVPEGAQGKCSIDNLELGKSLAKPVNAEGDEAVVRRTEHGQDCHLLEDVAFEAGEDLDTSTLSPLDLCVILALCLDTKNQNPRDGLTNEQMGPYVAAVLRRPGNWMIYSTGLLQRAWIDFERPHAMERAALQLQALLDQHTTRLTITQAALSAVESAAPAEQRLDHIHGITYPPRWELLRDLALRYMHIGVYGSAAEILSSLEMWDEAVQCYTAMDLPGKAEAIVQERLSSPDTATPQMWCALGDLKLDPDCYVKSWELSGGRYARAKTALGRLYFSRGEYEEAIGHFTDAVTATPLLPGSWFTMGAAYMRLSRWDDALKAFTRVVQQRPEEGEAWGNCGAVHLRRKDWASAAAAFTEGLKHQRDNWRMWENQITALMHLDRWGEVVYAMHKILDLREKHNKPLDVPVLALLVDAVIRDEGGAGDVGQDGLPHLASRAAELLGRIASTVKCDEHFWEVYAVFNAGMKRGINREIECREKQCRSITSVPGWEKDEECIQRFSLATEALVALYRAEQSPASLYKARMHIKRGLSKIEAAHVVASDFASCLRLREVLQESSATSPAAAGED